MIARVLSSSDGSRVRLLPGTDALADPLARFLAAHYPTGNAAVGGRQANRARAAGTIVLADACTITSESATGLATLATPTLEHADSIDAARAFERWGRDPGAAFEQTCAACVCRRARLAGGDRRGRRRRAHR